MIFDALDNISMVVLMMMIVIAALLSTIYVLDIFWNFFRAAADQDRGLNYYFSRRGPEN